MSKAAAERANSRSGLRWPEAVFEELAHNGLAVRAEACEFLDQIGAATGGLCASSEAASPEAIGSEGVAAGIGFDCSV